MDKVMNIDPGLMIWTLLTFGIFLFIVTKLGTKPIINALRKREESIKDSIEGAEQANAQAKQILKESEAKLNTAYQEMSEIVNKGRQQAEDILKKAAEDADVVKKAKIDEAIREIERNKEIAIKELRTEVAGLVVQATEKILGETLDKEKHYKLVESYIEKLPNN